MCGLELFHQEEATRKSADFRCQGMDDAFAFMYSDEHGRFVNCASNFWAPKIGIFQEIGIRLQSAMEKLLGFEVESISFIG